MGISAKNGHYELSFFCLDAAKFDTKLYIEALAGLIMQVQELSATLRVK